MRYCEWKVNIHLPSTLLGTLTQFKCSFMRLSNQPIMQQQDNANNHANTGQELQFMFKSCNKCLSTDYSSIQNVCMYAGYLKSPKSTNIRMVSPAVVSYVQMPKC